MVNQVLCRPLSPQIKHYTEELNKTLHKLDPNIITILGGDVNINILNQSHTDTSEYTTTLLSHNLIPQILTPTRITDDKATCLDHIFVRLPKNQIDNNILSGNIIAQVADHLPNFVYTCSKNIPSVLFEHNRLGQPLTR